ncbi:efflux RND transporter periplasmic adaptor subunit [Gymnodinialimonas sp. 2305UL16-5]|uniref:efflux RND transporter periplasmic adaptor subunit n=1 Tax=Gymnodinialimonas mytili TaxID=3126503 RepID=UPI0030A52C12
MFWTLLRAAACFFALLVPWAASAQAGDTPTTPTRPALVAVAQTVSANAARGYPAVVYPSEETEMSFRVSGQLIDLPIRASMEVFEGDIIARLDPRDFQTNVLQLQSQLDQAAAELSALRSGARAEEISALEASVAAAEAQVGQLSEQLRRSQELQIRGVVSAARVEQDQAALSVAEAELRSSQEQLRIGQAGGRAEEVEAAEAAIRGLQAQLQIAEDNLADTVLRAPFDGFVALRHVENFTNMQAGQSVALIQGLSIVDLVFDIPGPDVVYFAGVEDFSISVTFDALPGRTYEAELIEFATQAERSTQTYRGRVAVAVPEEDFVLPGMIGRVDVASNGNGAELVTVPLGAIGADPQGQPVVWVLDPETNLVSSHDVVLGDVMGDRAVILDGVPPDATVIAAGLSALQDGMQIRPITDIEG